MSTGLDSDRFQPSIGDKLVVICIIFGDYQPPISRGLSCPIFKHIRVCTCKPIYCTYYMIVLLDFIFIWFVNSATVSRD